MTSEAEPTGQGVPVVGLPAPRAGVTGPDGTQYPGLLPEDVALMTPEQIEWVRAQRITEPEDAEECKVPSVKGQGRCAYAGPDGKDACGVRCLYKGAT